MSIGNKPLMQGLLVATDTIAIRYALSYIPAVRSHYAQWLHVRETVYIPHQAPDSAFLAGSRRSYGCS